MSEFPTFEYTADDVLRAGKALGGAVAWGSEGEKESARQVFKIAYNWRDSHALPMRRVRISLLGQMRRARVKGITAARLKRMPSIRRKLARLTKLSLNEIQDLAGCRAVLESIQDVDAVIASLRSTFPHTLLNENDYIRRAKRDGYRSHHLIFAFRGVGEEELFNGRRVELQMRTRLQHSWATAVEAVGLFRREDFKAGAGDLRWRRLFVLMSREFALLEACVQEEARTRRERRAEIVQLDRELDATNMLENLRWAMQYTDNYYFDPNSKPQYFLIKYSRSENVVQVEPYYSAISGAEGYDSAELASVEALHSEGNSINAVLVEADEIENLKAAYPNYFGDVDQFKKVLVRITRGEEPQEYVLPPQATVPKRSRGVPDLSWFTRPRFNKPKGS